MSLLDDLRSVLTRHHQHVTSQTNQGTAHLIEAHLKALETVGADAGAHAVLDQLYGALNAPAPVETPAVAPKASKTAKAATAEAPVAP